MAMVANSQTLPALQLAATGEILEGTSGKDRITGTFDSDTIYGRGGDDVLAGGAGNDRIVGGEGIDTAVLFGRSADYVIDATTNGIRVTGPDGTDTLIGIEVIAADDGTFIFDYEIGSWAKVSNTPGQALLAPELYLKGTAASDSLGLDDLSKPVVIDGFAGNDTLIGGRDNDLVRGGSGNDFIIGDRFDGGGSDRVYGGAGRDIIQANGGADRIYGGRGADQIRGDTGDDTTSGGLGSDTFSIDYQFRKVFWIGWGNDVITDFEIGTDRIVFSSETSDASLELRSNNKGEAVIQLVTSAGDGPGTITLQGVSASGLSLDDFLA